MSIDLNRSGKNIYCINEMEFWTIKSKLYKFFRNHFPFNYFLLQENQSILYLLQTIPDPIETVIDLGTGNGNGLALLPDHVMKVGIDANFPMLAQSKERVKAEYVNSDIMMLALKSAIADLILLIGVLEYYSKYDALLSEIYRVVKSKGYVILTSATHSVWSLFRNFLGHRIHPMNFDQMKKCIERNGFRILHYRKLAMQHQFLIIT